MNNTGKQKIKQEPNLQKSIKIQRNKLKFNNKLNKVECYVGQI